MAEILPSAPTKSTVNRREDHISTPSQPVASLYRVNPTHPSLSQQFTLFISAPWDRVVSVRFPHSCDESLNFGTSAMGTTLRARIELLLGIHASSYDFYVGTQKLNIPGDGCSYVITDRNSVDLTLMEDVDNPTNCDIDDQCLAMEEYDDKTSSTCDVRSRFTATQENDVSSRNSASNGLQSDVINCLTKDNYYQVTCMDKNDDVTHEGTDELKDKNIMNDDVVGCKLVGQSKSIYHSEITVKSDHGEILHSGTLLKIVPRPGWEGVFEIDLGQSHKNDFDLLLEGMRDARIGTPNNVEGSAMKGIAALFLASHQGRTGIVCRLLQESSEHSSKAFDNKELTPYGRTLLHAACAGDQPDLVSLLLTRFVHSPLVKDAFNQSPLAVAINCGSSLAELQMLRFLRSNRNRQVFENVKNVHNGRMQDDKMQSDCMQDKKIKDDGMQDDRNIDSRMQSCNEKRVSRLHNLADKQHLKSKMCITGVQGNSNQSLIESARFKMTVAESSLEESDVPSFAQPFWTDVKQRNNSAPEKYHRIFETPSANIGQRSSTFVSESTVIDQTCCRHRTCVTGRPFVAIRRVDPEKEGVTVQFVPLDRPQVVEGSRRGAQTAQLRRLRSAATLSIGQCTDEHSLGYMYDDELTIHSRVASDSTIRRNTGYLSDQGMPLGDFNRRGGGTKPTYYRTKYHAALTSKGKEKPVTFDRTTIPAMARKSYRPWKTWLAELYAQRAISAPQSRDDDAFRHWLRESRRRGWGGAVERREEQEEEERMDERRKEIKAILNPIAFQKWLDKKNAHNSTQRAPISPATTKAQNIAAAPQDYLHCHSAWAAGTADERRGRLRKLAPSLTPCDLGALRRELILGGVTYDEWMQLKELEAARDAANKSNEQLSKDRKIS